MEETIKFARPKKYIIYKFGFEAKCYIHCYPQQTWKYTIDGNMVYLSNEKKHIDIIIPLDDFKKHWVKNRIKQMNM